MSHLRVEELEPRQYLHAGCGLHALHAAAHHHGSAAQERGPIPNRGDAVSPVRPAAVVPTPARAEAPPASPDAGPRAGPPEAPRGPLPAGAAVPEGMAVAALFAAAEEPTPAGTPDRPEPQPPPNALPPDVPGQPLPPYRAAGDGGQRLAAGAAPELPPEAPPSRPPEPPPAAEVPPPPPLRLPAPLAAAVLPYLPTPEPQALERGIRTYLDRLRQLGDRLTGGADPDDACPWVVAVGAAAAAAAVRAWHRAGREPAAAWFALTPTGRRLGRVP
jgi:hypothetical protein